MLTQLVVPLAILNRVCISGPLSEGHDKDETPRLALGSEGAKAQEAKYVVAVTHSERSIIKETGFFCTGSIIHVEWVLTAAHCLTQAKDRPSAFAVVAGADEKSQLALKSSQIQKRDMLRVILHPKYWRDKVSKYDVGLVQVEKFEFNERVGAAQLWAETWPYEKDKSAKVEYGTIECMSFGWGSMELGSGGSDKLAKMNMTASHGTKACSCFRMYMQRRLICTTRNTPSGLCPGDSGGPLVCQDKLAGIAHIIFDKRQCSSLYIGQIKLKCNSPYTISVWMYACAMLDFISEHVPDVPKKPESCRASLLNFQATLILLVALMGFLK